MLSVACRWQQNGQWHRLDGQVYNITQLAARSDYDHRFEGRALAEESARVLKGYPRWAESCRALVARCLALSKPLESDEPDKPTALAPSWGPAWQELVVQVELQGARSTKPRLLAIATALRNPEPLKGQPALSMGWSDLWPGEDLSGFADQVLPRAEGYPDPWALAEHTLRQGAFGEDALPACSPLSVPVHKSQGGLAYVRACDIPQPARREFARRMAHSTRPLIDQEGDTYYAWDWNAFLNGGR